MENVFSFSEKEKLGMQKLGIAALVLFGSRARGLEKKNSDYDIGVLTDGKMGIFQYDRKAELYNILYDTFSSHINKLVNIDIVFLEDASVELQAHVTKYGKVIFEADKSAFSNFKERAMIKCADFAPLKTIFHTGILSQIKS